VTNYKKLVADFAERTRANLAVIDQLAKHGALQGTPEVFEVTQLINSMLGLLVLPQQRFVNDIPKTPMSELEAKGWPCIRANAPYKNCNTLQELVRKLRNSIAHFNIKFTERGGQINGVQVWNKPFRAKKPDWEADLSLEELSVSRGIAANYRDVH
jgi:hypothetical protein